MFYLSSSPTRQEGVTTLEGTGGVRLRFSLESGEFSRANDGLGSNLDDDANFTCANDSAVWQTTRACAGAQTPDT